MADDLKAHRSTIYVERWFQKGFVSMCDCCRGENQYPAPDGVRQPAAFVIGVSPTAGRTLVCKRCAFKLAFEILEAEFG